MYLLFSKYYRFIKGKDQTGSSNFNLFWGGGVSGGGLTNPLTLK